MTEVVRIPNLSDTDAAALSQRIGAVGFRATGSLAGLGFNDRTLGTQWQLYASGGSANLYNGSSNVFSISTAGSATIAGTVPVLAIRDTDITGKAGAFRFDHNYSAQGSFYNFLEGGGFKILVSDTNGGSFTSNRVIFEAFTNTAGRSDDTGSFFPNGGAAIGEDGYAILRTNVLEIYSTNNLHTADIPNTVSHTVTGGAVTALTIESGYAGYTANLDPAGDANDRLAENRIAAQGFGRSSLTNTNFVGYFATDASGQTTGTVYIAEGGTAYVQDEIAFVPSPPPSSTKLDVGPQLNMTRDAAAGAGSILGGIVFQGRYDGSSSADANYAQILTRVQNSTEATADARVTVATVDSAASAGSTGRWDIGKEFGPYGHSNVGVNGAVHGAGFYISGTSIFDMANTWSAAQIWTANPTFRSTDAGAGQAPIVILDRDSASPAASDNLGAVYFRGNDDAGNNHDYAVVKAVLIDPGNGSEDGRLDVQTSVAGTLANRAHFQAGFRMATVASDPGAGAIAATSYHDVNGTKVVGTQGAAVADATDAASAITQLNALLARMRAHGLIAT